MPRFFYDHLMFGVAVVLAVLLPSMALAEDTSTADQSRLWHQRFARAGFTPMVEVVAQGRNVRRLILVDPYGMLPIPAIEVEKRYSGQVVVKIQHRYWTTDARSVDSGIWTELEALAGEVFVAPEPPRKVESDNGPPPPPPRICHGWSVLIESHEGHPGSWSECSGEERASLRYALVMVRAALSTRPDCAVDPNNIFWSYQDCFGPKTKLDDPLLDEPYSDMVKAFDALNGTDPLANARVALRDPNISLGNATWEEARALVMQVRAHDKRRRELLQEMSALYGQAWDASDADQEKIHETIDLWTAFIMGTEANTFELFEMLVAGEK